MRKKILIVTDNLEGQINGVVTTYKNLEIMASNDRHDIVYINPGQFRYFSAPGYSEIKLAWVRKIGKKIREIQPDYIHIATEGPLGLAARIWCDRKNLVYNTAYHTKLPEALKKLTKIPEFISWNYVRWFHKHAGRVLTTTDSMVQDLKSHGFDGDIIPWTRGVDRTIFHSDYREESDHDGPILLCVSRISKEKNLDEFCKIEYPRARKILVGDGPYRKELEKKYPDVEFVGFKTGEELAWYYANADVFVFPSRWETFGIVMIEAMACGTPVAAYPCSGPLDVVDQGITGIMDENLSTAIYRCLGLNREKVKEASMRWSWEECWKIFKNNLIKI